MTLGSTSEVRLAKRYRAHLRRYGRCAACRFREQTDGTYHCQRRPERQGTCDTDGILPAFRFEEEVLEGMRDAP